MVKQLEKELALEIARKYQPKIYQEIKDIKDFITPILLGELAEHAIIEQLKNPILYFKSSEDFEFYYILFMIYHPFDYSTSSVFKSLDEHRHDTESVLIRINKKTKTCTVATVSHHSFIFARLPAPVVFVSAETHAIKPIDSVKIENKKMLMLYQDTPLDNMGEYTEKEIKVLTEEFNKTHVNFPTQMSDNVLKLQSINEREEFKHEVGDIWYRPDRVFKSAERFGKI